MINITIFNIVKFLVNIIVNNKFNITHINMFVLFCVLKYLLKYAIDVQSRFRLPHRQ